MSEICGIILNLKQSVGKLGYGIFCLHHKICLDILGKKGIKVRKFLPSYRNLQSHSMWYFAGQNLRKQYEALLHALKTV